MPTPAIENININQLKSFSLVFPDSCTLLSFILNEEEFKLKIDYLRKVLSNGIPCELLPKVNSEILDKLKNTVTDFISLLKKCKANFQKIESVSLEKTLVDKKRAEQFELAFARVYFDLHSTHFPKIEQKTHAFRRARVVESVVMEEFAQVLEKGESISIKGFFDRIEKNLSEKYSEFCQRQAEFTSELKMVRINPQDFFEVNQELDKDLVHYCRLDNSDDRELIAQAYGRMYKANKWGAVVSTDYCDIIRSRAAIDLKTQLIVSDPLYFTYRLEKKINLDLHPRNAAIKSKITWRKYLKQPTNIGVV
jgi:hypothetical protein